MEKISFLKIRDVKSPLRANQFDAGIDFFVPKFTKQFISDLKEKNPLVFGETQHYSSGSSNIYIGCDAGF